MAQEMEEINSKGTYHLHGKERNPGWKIKRSAPFRLGSFRKHRMGLEAMQLYIFYSFESVNMIWICVGLGCSPLRQILSIYFYAKDFHPGGSCKS